MRVGKGVTTSGIVMLIFGIIFHLQGQSVIGPETSFMYSNPEWITYGMQITSVGIIIVGVGIIIIKKSQLHEE
ncbi:hypothetical protein BD31_I1580 [Candidatus Nitrosopumilus salaria BD31]|uniref:Uncharacterized protein n=1 Tax=Candidatus Nitrosopumilus salarius BD31 TaxID=859350 RepID=I3D3Z8_9ARCH|nr:hypothetical protein [Candidatus Nitrosopumilus salaria]EIJ66441.1 hypothetical protein BD31_I1580 [Candidatus Nitrosopumilus salaria BD31]